MSFIMSENIQILRDGGSDDLRPCADSNIVLTCQRAPKMSVPESDGESVEEFVSNEIASWRRARSADDTRSKAL